MAWTAPRRPICCTTAALRIYTTVDPDLQAVMENALERGYSSFFPTSGLGVATQATKYNEDGTIARMKTAIPSGRTSSRRPRLQW